MVRQAIRSVLVLDDDQTYLDECTRAFHPREVLTASVASEALELARSRQPDLVLVDLRLGEDFGQKSKKRTWGIDVIRELRSQHPSMLLVLVTSGYSSAYDAAARAAGANAVMSKLIVTPYKLILIVEAGMLDDPPADTGPMTLARAEYEHLTRVYMDNDRNATKTAADLGIPRSTLYRKLNERAPRR